MQSYTFFVIAVGIIAFFMCSTVWTVPPPQCSPSILVNADAKYRQICMALRQLANVLEDDRDVYEPLENEIKRKDVDHVFLRFGRPRI